MLLLATILIVWTAIATVFVAACVTAARADRRAETRTIRAHRTITLAHIRRSTARQHLRSLA